MVFGTEKNIHPESEQSYTCLVLILLLLYLHGIFLTVQAGGPMLVGLAEAQHEASRLCHLKHPCIVSFLGASIYPPCVLLEFAPLGSLFQYLKKKLKEEEEALLENMTGQQVVVEFPDGVLGRELTVQVAYQVNLKLRK